MHFGSSGKPPKKPLKIFQLSVDKLRAKKNCDLDFFKQSQEKIVYLLNYWLEKDMIVFKMQREELYGNADRSKFLGLKFNQWYQVNIVGANIIVEMDDEGTITLRVLAPPNEDIESYLCGSDLFTRRLKIEQWSHESERLMHLRGAPHFESILRALNYINNISQ